MSDPRGAQKRAVERQRNEIVRQLEGWLEWPMLLLGIAWLAILVLELTRGISPTLEAVSRTIWIIFIIDFVFRVAIAPRRLHYIRNNWLTAIALLLPALRVLRLARALRLLRAARGVRLVRIITSLNRGMRALGGTLQLRGAGYIAALTVLVVFGGAAGMYAFERGSGDSGIQSFGHALWWTAMLITTIGSDFWPATPEGRILTLLLASSSLGILGYLTATLATFFIGREAHSRQSDLASEASLQALRHDLAQLRRQLPTPPPDHPPT